MLSFFYLLLAEFNFFFFLLIAYQLVTSQMVLVKSELGSAVLFIYFQAGSHVCDQFKGFYEQKSPAATKMFAGLYYFDFYHPLSGFPTP